MKWKQFDPSKPVRHCIKSYLLCEALSGYSYNEEIYYGKVQGENNSIDQIVNKFLDVFSNKGYQLFMDNFFTSYSLINDLETLMIGISGTLRKNRKSIPKKISKPKIKKC